ncbi:MAG: MFS transporter [Candidatus Hydrogenedentes bacterium]|nr:MFS transporter [Candidatus Hydrogenedentota bacterium]
MSGPLTAEQHRWRYRIFAVTWVGYAGFYLCRKNFSVCMPMLTHDLGYSKTDFAHIIALYSLMYALGQFYNGILNDRFGPRLIVTIGHVIALACSVVMGFGHVYAVFFVFYVLNGVGQSTGWSGTVKNMATWFRHRERGVVMGYWCTCYVLGGLAATNFATWAATNELLFPQLGWRRGFWAPAIALAVVSALYVVFTRNKPSDAGLPDFPEDDDAPVSYGAPVPVREEVPFWDVFKEVYSKPVIWLTGGTYFLVKATRYAFIFWLPLYLSQALAYSDAKSGYMSSVYEFVGFFGVILAGYLSDKVWNSRRFPITSIMLFGLAAACFIHPHLAGLGTVGCAVGIGLIGMMTFGPDAIMSGPAAQDMGSQRGAAMAAGIINGLGSFGQIISPYIVALIADSKYGWNGVFYLFVVFAIVSGGLMATLWNYGGHQPAASAR